MLKRILHSRLNPVLSKFPDRVHWELMRVVPGDAAAPNPADSEFRQDGIKTADSIIERITEQDYGFEIDGADVLEIGSGPGRIAVPMAESGANVNVIDISSVTLKEAKNYAKQQGVTLTAKQAEDHIPEFETNFDLIYSINVFQHIRKRTTVQYLLDSYDQLKEGGILYISVPDVTNESNLNKLFGPGLERTDPFRMRYFSKSEVRAYMKHAGFSDIQIIDVGEGLHAIGKA